MSEPTGLGKPRGPHFVAGPLRRHLVRRDQPPAPEPPRFGPGIEPPPAARVTRREFLGTALLAVVAGSVGGGIAGLITDRDPAPDQVSPNPSTQASGDLSAVAERVLPSVVSVEVRRDGRTVTGSGFVVDNRGHVVTNAHVVGDANDAVLTLHNGRRMSAAVIGRDPDTDIAVLRPGVPDGLRPLPWGRSTDVEVGDPVLAIGSPLGLSGTVTSGIVSSVNRPVRLGSGVRQSVVQTDASINPGNSGGPLVNARGQVIGVTTASVGTSSGGNTGLGFAIPADRAASVTRRLTHN